MAIDASSACRMRWVEQFFAECVNENLQLQAAGDGDGTCRRPPVTRDNRHRLRHPVAHSVSSQFLRLFSTLLRTYVRNKIKLD